MYVCVVSLLYNLDLRTKSIFVFAGYKLFEIRFEPYGYETDTHYQALTVLISNVWILYYKRLNTYIALSILTPCSYQAG